MSETWNVPYIRMRNKFPLEERRASIASAVVRGLPEITQLIDFHQDGSAVVIGGGPSSDQHVEKIRALQAAGSVVISIERMYPWCHQHGVTPYYVVAQDGSADVTEAFTTLWPGSVFLMASQCQSAVFDRLAREEVYFFHTPQHGIAQDELSGPGPVGTIINAGGSVVLCSLSLAMLLGLSTIHLFGFDCHVTNGHYANGIAGVGIPPERLEVKVQGRAFTTTLPYIGFARQFFELKDIGQRDGLLKTITVYGDSLVTAMSKAPTGA